MDEAYHSEQLGRVDKQRLTPLVSQALDDDQAGVLTWNHRLLHGGIGGGKLGTAVYLFEGLAFAGERQRPWSLVLKVLDAREGEAPSSSHYWRREVEVYRSGWLDSLEGPLVGPRCYGVEEHGEQGCWLWLEQVTQSGDAVWSLARYGLAAKHLAQFNYAHMRHHSSPTWPWLCADLITGEIATVVPGLSLLRQHVDHPLVRRLLPGRSAERFFRQYDQRETYFKWLAPLPQALCHFDAHRRNLIARQDEAGREQTVAIDWAFTGYGPLGAETVALVWVSLISRSREVEPSLAAELDQVVFEGYIEGLRQAGWQGDPRTVRLAQTAALVIRRLGTLGYVSSMLLADQLQAPETAEALDDEWLSFFDNLASLGRFAEASAEEAGQLAASLGRH